MSTTSKAQQRFRVPAALAVAIAAAAVAALTGASAWAQAPAVAPAKQRYVQGSWVNLRESAQSQARIVAQVPANTVLQQLTERDGWCAVLYAGDARLGPTLPEPLQAHIAHCLTHVGDTVQAGQVLLFTLISLHALVLLTLATVVLELQMAREQAAATGHQGQLWRTVGQAVRSALLHPVPLPILVGLLYAQTGWGLHPVVDKPLQLLGSAFGPIALVLVGITLSQTPIGKQFVSALKLSLVKTVVHPALMLAVGWLLGLRGLHLAVMTVAAALPIGANVFLFSQRYRKEEDAVTAGVAVSTAMAVVSVTAVMAVLPLLPV